MKMISIFEHLKIARLQGAYACIKNQKLRSFVIPFLFLDYVNHAPAHKTNAFIAFYTCTDSGAPRARSTIVKKIW